MAQLEPPKINSQKFNRRLGRLKYMQSFYEKKLDLCEEKQRGLFEDLISALKYTISFMEQSKSFSDFYWSDENAANRIDTAIEQADDAETSAPLNEEEAPASKTSKEELEELAS